MPIRYIKTLANGSSLCLWHIEESEEELRSNLSISNREEKELLTIRSEKGRVRWLAVRRALNVLFPNGVSECLKDEHGKPYIENFGGYISLSHSNDFAIAMVHAENAVGVDIEIIQPKIRRIAQKFLKDFEIERVHGEHEIERLYVCWCAKEAIFKWQGKKGISLKQNIEIEAFEFQEIGTLRARLYTSDYSQYLTVDYEEMDGYLLAYVCNA
jgi:4'-phosphopantetheinyl transferase